jgi:putative tricarboxylic transport membrane protein
MSVSIKSPKDFWCGLLLLAIAAIFVLGLFRLPIGTAFRMGPGYFPMVLTILLAILGVAILINGLRLEGPPVAAIPLRELLLIALPIVFFGLTLRGLGLVPSLTITVFATTLAARGWRAGAAVSTTLVLVAGCIAIFAFGLRLPLSLFGPWVGGY